MSVVAGKIIDESIVVAADSQVTWGQAKTEGTKLYKIGENLIFGGAGLLRDINLMRLFLDTHTPASAEERDVLEFYAEFVEWGKRKLSSFEPKSEFMFAFDGKLFETGGDFDVFYYDYGAIGSGWEYARAALHLGHTPTQAVAVACDLTIFCMPPVTEFRIPRHPQQSAGREHEVI
ncbi:hypothetical protein B4N89_03405 [Embleya scabrispora]|uniref:Proteasome subunit beta n=1 Tax=Embleya scabrispora TaxID=159449 RepID=A0A1T3NTW8_9ACTN|nr:hypothetical protein [Embleya scabrispora]OPC80122.1 hypothetical protein B4N89_03405 [Embleya scabrispora]